MEAIEVSHLTFSYDGKNDILKDVSFSIPKGSYTTIIGHNGSGKSNLGFAIFDLISHITDKEIVQDYYKNYFNADLNETKSKFSFEFRFDKNILEYSYTKSDYQTLISEELKINGKEYLYIDREKSSIFRTSAKGAKSLKKDIGDSNISIIKI